MATSPGAERFELFAQFEPAVLRHGDVFFELAQAPAVVGALLGCQAGTGQGLDELGVFGLVEMVLFIGFLATGILYAWRRGVLRWV